MRSVIQLQELKSASGCLAFARYGSCSRPDAIKRLYDLVAPKVR